MVEGPPAVADEKGECEEVRLKMAWASPGAFDQTTASFSPIGPTVSVLSQSQLPMGTLSEHEEREE